VGFKCVWGGGRGERRNREVEGLFVGGWVEMQSVWLSTGVLHRVDALLTILYTGAPT
jgi:hypothetical protein